mmetsp:Transcript_40464/g.96963  ORF Transcript_40464/g.96963 Transcript_40464/m.96963 type:complete len:245 (-) Transcript_40464:27-761(-)
MSGGRRKCATPRSTTLGRSSGVQLRLEVSLAASFDERLAAKLASLGGTGSLGSSSGLAPSPRSKTRMPFSAGTALGGGSSSGSVSSPIASSQALNASNERWRAAAALSSSGSVSSSIASSSAPYSSNARWRSAAALSCSMVPPPLEQSALEQSALEQSGFAEPSRFSCRLVFTGAHAGGSFSSPILGRRSACTVEPFEGLRKRGGRVLLACWSGFAPVLLCEGELVSRAIAGIYSGARRRRARA